MARTQDADGHPWHKHVVCDRCGASTAMEWSTDTLEMPFDWGNVIVYSKYVPSAFSADLCPACLPVTVDELGAWRK